jgi:hypothetical protein
MEISSGRLYAILDLTKSSCKTETTGSLAGIQPASPESRDIFVATGFVVKSTFFTFLLYEL